MGYSISLDRPAYFGNYMFKKTKTCYLDGMLKKYLYFCASCWPYPAERTETADDDAGGGGNGDVTLGDRRRRGP